MSESQFVANSLDWRASIDPLIPTFDGVILGKDTFASFLGIVNLDSLELLGWELGRKHFLTSKALFESNGEQLTFIGYLSRVLCEHARWFRIEGDVNERSKEVILHHDFKIKWSVFLKNYISGAYEVVSRSRLEVSINDSFLKIRFPD